MPCFCACPPPLKPGGSPAPACASNSLVHLAACVALDQCGGHVAANEPRTASQLQRRRSKVRVGGGEHQRVSTAYCGNCSLAFLARFVHPAAHQYNAWRVAFVAGAVLHAARFLAERLAASGCLAAWQQVWVVELEGVRSEAGAMG